MNVILTFETEMRLRTNGNVTLEPGNHASVIRSVTAPPPVANYTAWRQRARVRTEPET